MTECRIVGTIKASAFDLQLKPANAHEFPRARKGQGQDLPVEGQQRHPDRRPKGFPCPLKYGIFASLVFSGTDFLLPALSSCCCVFDILDWGIIGYEMENSSHGRPVDLPQVEAYN